MELEVSLTANGVPVLGDLEWSVKERKGVHINVELPGSDPLTGEGIVFLTTERLVFVLAGGRSVSVPFACMNELQFKKRSHCKKELNFTGQLGQKTCLIQVVMNGKGFGELVSLIYSLASNPAPGHSVGRINS